MVKIANFMFIFTIIKDAHLKKKHQHADSWNFVLFLSLFLLFIAL